MRRALALLAVAVLGLFGLAGTASAHNVLISSDPAAGAQLATGPGTVTLTFDQYVQDADVNQVAVTGPDGTQWAEGPVRVQGNVVSAPVRPLGPAGKYTVGYRILSADGHPVPGEIPFTLTTAGTGTPAAAGAAKQAVPTGAEGEQGGVPIWVWIGGAVLLLGIGLVVALRAGRDTGGGRESEHR